MVVEHSWRRRSPFVQLNLQQIEALIQPFACGAKVLGATPLSGGLRNTNYRFRLSSVAEPLVLRLYGKDPTACRRESALAQLVGGTVPVPAVEHVEPDAQPPWAVVRWVEAPRFDALLNHGSTAEIEAAARSAGRVLANIHRFELSTPGFFGPDLQVMPPPGPRTGWFGMLEESLAHGRAGRRLGPQLTERLVRFIGDNAWRMQPLMDHSHLVHADYKSWNLLVRDDQIAAVLDWEFAFSGPPINDIGIFLRHSDSLPSAYRDGFVAGYSEAGGELPDDWPRLARLIDLLSMCYFLDRPEDEDDPAVLRDVQPLIEATLRDFGP